MRRALALLLSTTTVLAAGCGYHSYETRLEATESRIRDEMTLDSVLAPAVRDNFEKLSMHFRPPAGWTASPDFAPERRQGEQNLFDDSLVPYFDVKGSYKAPAPEGGAETKKAEGPPPPSPMLRVLGRRKEEKTDVEAPPEQPPVERGEFVTDVMQVLESLYGPDARGLAPETVNKTIWPRSTPPKSLPYERYKFTGGSGQLVQVYLIKETAASTQYDLALVFEFPDGQVPAESTSPVDLTLGTVAVGNRAARLFRGDSDDTGDADASGTTIAF